MTLVTIRVRPVFQGSLQSVWIATKHQPSTSCRGKPAYLPVQMANSIIRQTTLAIIAHPAALLVLEMLTIALNVVWEISCTSIITHA